MRLHNAISSAATVCLLLGAPGCLKDDTLETNRIPLAIAGVDQEVDLTGTAIEVQLDGTKSTDLDGRVASYDWRYVAPPVVADEGDGGAPSGPTPAELELLDPADEARPAVSLPGGTHTFMLWVTDNQGAVSPPDDVTITVVDPNAMGAPAECVAGAYEEVEPACAECTCGVSPACAMAIPTCGNDCYGLIGCIVSLCPTFSMDMDTACVIMNCAQWLGGMTGASAVGDCISPCATECTPSITTIVMGGPGG